MMTLHWSPRSPFVRKVMVAAHELGLAGEIGRVRTVVGLDVPHAGLMGDNPVNKIPTLVLADGTVLHDSLVICMYLNDRAAGALFPADGAARWDVLTRHAMANGLLDALVLWRYELGKPAQTQALLDIWALKTTATLDRLEATVPAFSGRFGIDGITVAVLLAYLDFRFGDLAWRVGRPALTGWHVEVSRRGSMVATGAAEG